MKKIILITIFSVAAMMFATNNSAAQNFEEFDESLGTYERIYKRGPYLTGKFLDNWFVGAGFGVNVYNGTDKSKAGFGVDISLGKMITPSLGLRGQFTGIMANGESAIRTPYTKNDLKGNGKYDQHFNYFLYHLDVMWNISNSIGGYRNDRLWEFLPYLGIGAASTKVKGDNTHWEFAPILGLNQNIRLGGVVDLTLDTKYAFFGTDLDLDSRGGRTDGAFTATIGANFKIGPKGGFKRTAKAVAANYAPYQDRINALTKEADKQGKTIDELKNELAVARKKVGEIIKTVDVMTDSITFEIGKSVLKDEGKAVVAKIVQEIKNNPTSKYTVIMTGYADAGTGTERRNWELSQERTINTAAEFVEVHGIPVSDIQTQSRGGVKTSPNPAADRIVTIVLKKLGK